MIHGCVEAARTAMSHSHSKLFGADGLSHDIARAVALWHPNSGTDGEGLNT
ncbi:hypothetical protein ACTI_42300 [Actinoplanes sp. OR16]|nr:hypothetical protein ACTI_42300 [Actinoplanes sp. OR16]